MGITNQNKKRQNLNRLQSGENQIKAGADQVEAKINFRRYLIAAAVSDLAIGISGFVILAVSFMLAVSNSTAETVNGKLYMALSFAALFVFMINYFINKIIYFYFNHFSPLPMKCMLISNIAAWLVMAVVYFTFAIGG